MRRLILAAECLSQVISVGCNAKTQPRLQGGESLLNSRVGRKGKPEAYYFSPQYKTEDNAFPYTIHGTGAGSIVFGGLWKRFLVPTAP
jgi:hypothetical protein